MGKWLTWAASLLLSLSATFAFSAPIAEAKATGALALPFASDGADEATVTHAPVATGDVRFGLPVADAEEEDGPTSDDSAGPSGAHLGAAAGLWSGTSDDIHGIQGRLGHDDQRRHLRAVRSSLAAP